jgi:hypothetical protein
MARATTFQRLRALGITTYGTSGLGYICHLRALGGVVGSMLDYTERGGVGNGNVLAMAR